MEAHHDEKLPVLIIDDVQSARTLLRDMLKELGFTSFVEAKDGQEGLEILKKQPVQMIFCDNLMDGMSGLDFLTCLRTHRSCADVPVIFVSAVGDVSTVEEAIDLGAVDYVVKPISFRKLRRKVDQIKISSAGSAEKSHEISLER